MSKLISFEDFLSYANALNATIGLVAYEKPNTKPLKKLIFDMIFWLNFVNLNLVLLGEFIFVIESVNGHHEFLEMIMALSYIGFVALGSFKTCIIMQKKSHLTTYARDMNQIFPNASIAVQRELNVQKYLKYSKFFSIMFSTMCLAMLVFFNFEAIAEWLIATELRGDVNAAQHLPYFMYAPWDWSGNHWSYYLLYGIQCWAGHTSVVAQFSSDLLLYAFIGQLIMHFEAITKDVIFYWSEFRALDFFYNFSKFLFLSYRLSERINDLFGLSLFVNFATSAVVMCFLGFQMSIGASFVNLMKLVLFLILMLTQGFLICHFGQLLTDASLSIADAAFNQNWIDSDVCCQKMLILITERAQKPVILKATTLVPVSRATMTQLLQISYKFFALLRTMYVQ
ncbi:odorant receptor 85b-like [Musca domestica]|uniref:Odorant receptor n=1 Tax=Musca domestica TaxID=7370 RepID=A0ABM3UYK5_MUSDO|nr:odorant receptor 85b-like [Musca domestica]